jgi:hypothetical protein
MIPRAAFLVSVIFVAHAGPGRAGAAPHEEASPGELLQTAERGPTFKDRFEALRGLGEIRDRKALRQWPVVTSLLAFAGDRNPRLARTAVVGLAKLYRLDPSIKEHIRAPFATLAADPTRHLLVRRETVTQLGLICRAGEFGDRGAMRVIAGMARSSKSNPPELRVAVLRTLGAVGDPLGAKPIRESLSSDSPMIRAAAFDGLLSALQGESGRRFYDASLPSILLALVGEEDTDAASRNRAIEAIGAIARMGLKVPGAEERFASMLRKSEDVEAVASAARALALMGSTQAAAAFAAAFDRFGRAKSGVDGGASVRTTLCAMAGELFATWAEDPRIPGTTVVPLVDMLGKGLVDADREVALLAVIALGNLYHPKYDRTLATQYLIAALGAKGMPEPVRAFAEDGLEVITGRALGSDADAWEEWFEVNKATLRPRARRRGHVLRRPGAHERAPDVPGVDEPTTGDREDEPRRCRTALSRRPAAQRTRAGPLPTA